MRSAVRFDRDLFDECQLRCYEVQVQIEVRVVVLGLGLGQEQEHEKGFGSTIRVLLGLINELTVRPAWPWAIQSLPLRREKVYIKKKSREPESMLGDKRGTRSIEQDHRMLNASSSFCRSVATGNW